jgi:hypothetical protein
MRRSLAFPVPLSRSLVYESDGFDRYLRESTLDALLRIMSQGSLPESNPLFNGLAAGLRNSG